MRVALNAWFWDQPTTGSGQYVRNLVAALHEVAPKLDIVPVQSHARGDLAKLWFEQVVFPRAEHKNADIAFVPYWAPPLYCSVPVAVTIHDVIPLALAAYRGGPLQRIYTSLVRTASTRAAFILTDSDFSRQDILRHLAVDGDRVRAIPLAADARLTPAVPAADVERVHQRYDLPESYVLYLGGFDRRKNIETLFQIYTWCGATIGHEYPLLITGDAQTPVYANNGRQMTLAQMAEELKLAHDEVRLIGRIAEEDKPAVCAGARCFLFTSIYEGFGLPPLEAMACGTPIVGSNAASIPEVVGNAGMLVDAFDARRMAGAVIAICTEDELYKRLRQRALLRASQFTWQRTALETLSALKGVAEPV